MPYNYVVSEETDGLTDMVKPTYAIQLCCEWYKKKLAFFLQIKGHKPWTEQIFKSKIKLGVPFMVPDLVYKWEELKLLNGNQMWEELTDTDKT
jgi:hypothetical protein